MSDNANTNEDAKTEAVEATETEAVETTETTEADRKSVV